ITDSCKPRKLEPGLAAIYSKPRDLITSTMKSEPERSVVNASTFEGSTSLGSSRAEADCAGAGSFALIAVLLATSPATPPAAPFKNYRRSTVSLLDID